MWLKHFVVYFMYLTFGHFVLFCREVQENIDDVSINKLNSYIWAFIKWHCKSNAAKEVLF